MSEILSIREAAGRLGVSETAVRKAITAGRVKIAGRHEHNDRPFLSWPDCRDQWHANSDAAKRSHVGGTGTSARRAGYTKNPPTDPVTKEAPPRSAGRAVPPPPVDHEQDDGADIEIHSGMTLNEAKTVDAIYAARQRKLDWQKDMKAVIPADEVGKAWAKLITAAKTRIMGIPAACKSRASDLPLPVVAAIESACREALEDLANGADRGSD